MKPDAVLASNLKVLREHKEGLTQAGLAKKAERWDVHIDRTAVTRIEAGRRDVRVSELLGLARALGMSPADLLCPPDGEALELGGEAMDGGQVLAWFAGDVSAPTTKQRERGYWEGQADLNGIMQIIFQMVDEYRLALLNEDYDAVTYWCARLSTYFAESTFRSVERSPGHPKYRADE